VGRREWILLLALSVAWGASFFFGKLALRELPPLTIALGRFGLAALTLVVAVRVARVRVPGRWRDFGVMGLLNNIVPFCLIIWAQTRITSGTAAILNAATPLFTVVVAHYLTADERMTRARVAGTLIGLAGVAVMMGPDALAGLHTDTVAELACVGAAVSYAFAGVYGRRFAGVPPLATAAGQLTAATAMLLPVVAVIDAPWTPPVPGAQTWAAVGGIALISTALGYVIYFRVLATSGATNVLLVTLLIPVTATALGVTMLGERLEARQLVGMALIGVGLLVVDGRLGQLVGRPGSHRGPRRRPV
jgi:drug/metabolite transporter (DMT)-like permease